MSDTANSTGGISRSFHFRRLWWGIGFFFIALIFAGSLLQMPKTELELPRHFDKWQHVFAYAVLMAWFVQLLPSTRWALLTAVLFLLMSGAIELLQGMSGFRSADAMDMLANSVGLGLGLLCLAPGLRTILQRIDAKLARRSRLY
jgi:VanZ family protein